MTARLRSLLAVAAAVATVPILMPSAASAADTGMQGCTPGYWKNHTGNWQEYQPTAPTADLFTLPTSLMSLGDQTLLTSLQGGGGPGEQGAAKVLLRASTAAFLNAAHAGVDYPYRRFEKPGGLQATVNSALASGDREVMLDLAAELDAANNLGCPLSNLESEPPSDILF